MSWVKRHSSLILALVIAASLKAVLTLTGSVTFNGDEAVVGTMARHILHGARPVFFYGQAYMGSLDAWLIAGAFRLIGESVAAIRIVQSLLYLLYIVTVYWLGRMWFEERRVADFAVILAAVPPVVVTTYTSATLGGYGESLVLGNLILGLGYLVIYGDKQKVGWAWLLLGLVGGLAFWTLGISGVYLLPVGLLGLWKFDLKKVPYYLTAGLGFFLGGLPWWLYNFQHDWAALAALSGPRLVETSVFERLVSLIFLGLPALLGMRMPWRPEYFPVWLVLLTLVFHLAVGLYITTLFRDKKLKGESGGRTLILTFSLVFMGVFVASRFGIDATGRYLIPLYLPLLFAVAEFAAAGWRRKPSWGVALVVAALGINAAGIWLSAVSPDKLTTQFDPITSFDNSHDQALIDFLGEHGELRGYTNYWVSFRLAFLTDEQVIYSAELPYKADLSYTPRDNRYAPYAKLVDASPQVAYITSKHPDLDQFIRDEFDGLGVSYQEAQIGDFHIFYQLSRPVRPEEIGYGDVWQE